MKRYFKSFLTLGVFSLALANYSCIEDGFDTRVATEEETTSSSKATEAMLFGIPAQINAEDADNGHYRWGYGAIMHIRDVMTGDMPIVYSSYDHFSSWETNKNQGKNYAIGQYIWNYSYKLIQTTNGVVNAVNEETATDAQLGMKAAGYAYRALAYLDLAQMFEYLPTDGTTSTNEDKNDVSGLTVPIVTNETTEEQVRNNPRATRQQMAEFILSDLDNAEKNISKLTISSKVMPHLDVVYGLKARYYMWLADYANAEKYARLAINATSGSVMTKADCLDKATGFNTDIKWMLASELTSEDSQVQTGIVNWTAWMSNEAQYGYAAAGPMSMIDASMYARISDTDFRKLMWKAPEGGALAGQESYLDEAFGASLPEYASLKFRPAQGNVEEYQVGSATQFPLMRVEEMYFIEAEAAAHQDAARGLALLESFMKTYRDSKYAFSGTDIVEEIVFQKRVELWGEGLTFFDIKRLDMPVIRGYAGTNFYDTARLNTTRRPAWMNLVIVQTEENNNSAVNHFNNPDPTDCYTPWKE